MTPEEIKGLQRCVAKWVASPEGQKQLKETAEYCRQLQIDAEQKRRDDIKWWHEIKDKPVTI